MRISGILRVGAIAAAGLILAACTHSVKPTDAQSGMGYSDSSGNAPSSYGANSGSGYETTANGEHVNSLKAPSSQTYYFSFDSNEVRPQDEQAMTIQANYMAAHPQARIRLEGNTDSRGSREYNVGLGWRRDQAVERFFMARGVSAQQIQMVSYGKEHPAVSGDTEQAFALNRRVNLTYTNQG